MELRRKRKDPERKNAAKSAVTAQDRHVRIEKLKHVVKQRKSVRAPPIVAPMIVMNLERFATVSRSPLG
jgi:hypothetical protein